MGFDTVELGHGTRLPLVEGILKMWEAGKIKISSLHNFCPLPPEIPRASPDCYQFSSHLEGERERAVRHSFKTIDFAKRLGAKFVVMHLGSVPIGDYTDRLVRMAEVGMHMSKGFVQLKSEAVKKREAQAANCFQRMLGCMTRVYDYAGERGIQLGIESRHSYEEIPSEREMMMVLEKFKAPVAGYWHDFGHVQVKHNLGFLDHVEWMQKVPAPDWLPSARHEVAGPGPHGALYRRRGVRQTDPPPFPRIRFCVRNESAPGRMKKSRPRWPSGKSGSVLEKDAPVAVADRRDRWVAVAGLSRSAQTARAVGCGIAVRLALARGGRGGVWSV